MTQTDGRLRTKSGRPLHPIGIGTWGLGSYPAYSPGAAMEEAAIRYAIDLGQNHIDTAEMYGHGDTERLVGWAVAPAKRADLFIASKLWKDHVALGTVRPAVEAMLQRLGTDYLDLLYIHAPWFDAPWQEAIPQIGQLIDEGLVRYCGVSNFNAERLREALSLASYPIMVNQLHYSCLHQQEVSPALRQLCQVTGVTLVAYLPLERGAVMEHAGIKSVAVQLGMSSAQLALAWLLSQQALPIPRALQPRHIEQNSAAGTVRLATGDILHVGSLGRLP